MPNPFQRYQGGSFEPIQGLAEAGANIGKMLGAGIANMGDSMAKGIAAFNENKAKFGAAMADGEIAGSQLLQQQQSFINASGIDPELANQYLTWDGQPDEALDVDALKSVADNPFLRYAKMLQTARDGLEKLPTMALPKALATLNAAKGSMAVVDQQMKLDQMVAQARLENVNNELPDSFQKTREVLSTEAGVDANNPFFKNAEQIRAGLVKSGVTPEEVEAGVQDYIKKVESSIASSGATDEQKAEFADSIAKYREGLRTDVGGVTDYGREDDFVQKSLADAYAAGQAAQAASQKPASAQQTPDVNAALQANRAKADENSAALTRAYNAGQKNTPQTKALEAEGRALYEERQALNAKLNGSETKGSDMAEGLKKLAGKAAEERKAPLQLKERLNILGSEILSEVTDKHLSRIVNGEKVTGMDVLKDITGQDIERNPTSKTAPSNVDDWGTGPSKLPEEYTPARKLMENAMEKLGINPRKPLTADQFLRVKEAAMAGIQTQKQTAAKTAEEVAKITPESVAKDATEAVKKATTPQVPAVKSQPFSVGRLKLGEEVYDEFLTSVQKESAAREFYKAKFGAVPVGFTDMYRKMYPEAGVRSTSIRVNGQDIPIMIDSKGNATPLKMGDAPDVVAQAKAKAVTFANTEIAEGVRLNGIFAGTVTGAQAFRRDYAAMANVRTAITRLVEINESGYESLSPTMRKEADQLQSEIIAALRVPIIGPGQVAIPEQEILARIINNPTALFSLESADRAALKGLMSRVDRELVNWPKSLGLEVNVSGNKSQTIRQLRLNRESKARMVGENE
jgi:hypothetical protein